MSLTANWSYPTAIRFGAGRIVEIADACHAAGIGKPLLITDRGLADMAITKRTLDLLEAVVLRLLRRRGGRPGPCNICGCGSKPH